MILYREYESCVFETITRFDHGMHKKQKKRRWKYDWIVKIMVFSIALVFVCIIAPVICWSKVCNLPLRCIINAYFKKKKMASKIITIFAYQTIWSIFNSCFTYSHHHSSFHEPVSVRNDQILFASHLSWLFMYFHFRKYSTVVAVVRLSSCYPTGRKGDISAHSAQSIYRPRTAYVIELFHI